VPLYRIKSSTRVPWNLSNQIAHRNCHCTHKHFLPIFWYPHQVNLEVRLHVRSISVPSHATTLPQPSLRLEGASGDGRNLGTLTWVTIVSTEGKGQCMVIRKHHQRREWLKIAVYYFPISGKTIACAGPSCWFI